MNLDNNNVQLQTIYVMAISRTRVMKFKDFQAPVLLTSTMKALNLGEKIQVGLLSRMRGNPVIISTAVLHHQ